MGLIKLITGWCKKKQDTEIVGEERPYDKFVRELYPFSGKIKQRTSRCNSDEAYARKKEDSAFLETLILALEGPAEEIRFRSSDAPTQVIDEARPILQKTLYDDFVVYSDITSFLDNEEKRTLGQCEMALGNIVSFAKSFKKCLDFYLNACSIDKAKLSKLNYSLLKEYETGNLTEADVFLLSSEGKLGEDFHYERLEKFRRDSAKLGIDANPTIKDVYEFFDSCIPNLTEKIIRLREATGDAFLKICTLKNKPAYNAILQVKEILEPDKNGRLRIDKNAAPYYLKELSAEQPMNRFANYKQALNECGLDGAKISNFKEGLIKSGMSREEADKYIISMGDITTMREKLSAMSETKSMDKKSSWRTNLYNL